MPAIEQQQWQETSILTWSDLSSNQWLDFRIALFDTETEQSAAGVSVESSSTIAEALTTVIVQGVSILQSPVVIRTRTEMIVSIVVSDRDYKGEMLKYLPLYERKSEVFNELLTAYDREFRKNEQYLEIVNRNLFIDTAIESLGLYERDLAIKTDVSLRYDQRREQITSRYRAVFDQTTEETIKSVAEAYGNGEVSVAKTLIPGVYEIKFIGKGIPNNMDGLKSALDIIIPAHLGIKYVYTFSPWADLKTSTWGEVATEAWETLKIWDEVS